MKACLLITCPLLIGLVIIINGTWPTKPRNQNTHVLNENIIVLRPSSVAGPVQGPGSGFWAGHQVGRVNSFFYKKIKTASFSKKNKSQRVCNRSCWVNPLGHPGHAGFFLLPFFLQPAPVPAPGRPSPGSTRRAGSGFKTMSKPNFFYKKTETEPKPVQTESARFFRFGSVFFCLARFFSVWLGFFLVGFDSVFSVSGL